MVAERSSFYCQTVEGLIGDVIAQDSKILIVCGGDVDRDVFARLRFANVTITNLDERLNEDSFPPYQWSLADAEDLPFEDGSFDWGVVSAGLHHCRSPHRALLELYRVSRFGIIGFESRDSAAMRLALNSGLIDAYELVAVAANGMVAGGVANTAVPNYVYRWTEREVEKTIASYAPHRCHEYRYSRELEIPWSVVAAGGGWRARVLKLLAPAARGVAKLFPSQANLFSFTVIKVQGKGALQPWIEMSDEGPAPNQDWIRRRLQGN